MGREKGHTGSATPEVKKSTLVYFLFLNRLLLARGSWKAHYRPVIDPWLLV